MLTSGSRAGLPKLAEAEKCQGFVDAVGMGPIFAEGTSRERGKHACRTFEDVDRTQLAQVLSTANWDIGQGWLSDGKTYA